MQTRSKIKASSQTTESRTSTQKAITETPKSKPRIINKKQNKPQEVQKQQESQQTQQIQDQQVQQDDQTKKNEPQPNIKEESKEKQEIVQELTNSSLQKSGLKIPRTFIGKKDNISANFFDDEKELIGEGGFAKVYKIINKATQEERAMKVIDKQHIPFQNSNAQAGATGTNEFIKEIQVLQKLVHPNIVRLFEFYEDSQHYYMITELVHGRELFDEITERDFFSEREAATIMHQVFSALAYCHNQGVVHRDIKPENILVQTGNQDKSQDVYNIKIIDWGLGAELQANQYLTQKCGTPYYAAPEIFKKKYDEKCDIWSAGVILYLLIGQEIPFYGENSNEVIQKILIGKYTMDQQRWKTVSDEGKDLIKKLLTYDPAHRINAQDALAHPWFTINMGTLQSVNSQNLRINLERLRDFNAQSKLQAATVSFITSQLLTSEEQKEMLKMFKGLDKNSDGLLSRQEIIEGYKKLFSAEEAEREVDKIFEAIDFDQSGSIDYNEFIAATIDKKILVTKNKLQEAFKLFDKDGDGFITASEIAKVLDDQINNYGKDVWDEIVKEADENGDGQISFDEFSNLMKKLITNEKSNKSPQKQKQQQQPKKK